ncbi:MAG: lytic transglycosylase domain-containing protein [Desulfovibrio sp.]|nr:MAG: lytic transglycosylase domain-containing protein [Desulfovibrio sp.]
MHCFSFSAIPAFFRLALCVAAFQLLAVPCRADVWGYEDSFGIIHLSDTQVDDNYVLVHEGPQNPHIGFDEIRRIIRENGGASEERFEDWIDAHIPDEPLLRLFPLREPSAEILNWIHVAGLRYSVDEELIYAVVEQESGFNVGAVSPKGAQGLMQIMPETQQMLGLNDPFNPERNIDAGVRYLRMMLDRFIDVRLALAAYNAGPEAVEHHGGVPPYAETTQYVARIMIRYSALKGL